MFRWTRNTLACLFMALVITGLFGSLGLAAENATCCDLCIAYIDYRTNDDEVVVLLNRGREPIDLTGYVLWSDGGQQFTFGVPGLNKQDPIIQPLDIVRVHVKHCDAFEDPRDFIWTNKDGTCRKSNVWNDEGDTGKLISPDEEVIDIYCY